MEDKSILVVSEQKKEHVDLTHILRKFGYNKIFATQGGANAWAYLKSKKIDCIISSYEMTEMSGLSLLTIVRKEESLATLPFFLTDSAFNKIKVLRAGQIGVTGLFVIPYDQEGIKDKLSRAIEKRSPPVVARMEKSLKQGIKLIEQQKYAQALALFEALVQQKESPEYYFNIGYIKTSQGKHSEAIEAFSKATQLDRLFVQAHETMGRVHRALGNHQQSEECLQTAAEIYLDSDKLGSAEGLLNEILESGSTSLNVFNSLGVIHRKKGNREQALRQYQKALKIHPDEPYIYYNIGRLYLEMKNRAKARFYFQAALNKDHGFEEARQVIKAIDIGLV